MTDEVERVRRDGGSVGRAEIEASRRPPQDLARRLAMTRTIGDRSPATSARPPRRFGSDYAAVGGQAHPRDGLWDAVTPK